MVREALCFDCDGIMSLLVRGFLSVWGEVWQVITGRSDSWFEPHFHSLHSTVRGRPILPGPSLHALSLSHPAASLASLVSSPPSHCPGHAGILFLKHPRNASSLGSSPAPFFVPVPPCAQLPAHLLSLGADLTVVSLLSSHICFLSVDHILPA